MRVAVRAAIVGMFTVAAVGLMMLTSTMVSVFTVTALAATTALIMGGTGDPLSTPKDTLPFIQQYMGMAVNNYIGPSSTATPGTNIPKGPYNSVAVITPEEWAPNTGTLTLDQSIAAGTKNLDNCIRATDCVYNMDVGSAGPAASDTFVVFGYSQSATIGTLEKRALAAEFPNGGGPNVSFVFIGNGNRPNGGFLARGPEGFTIPNGLIFGGATFNGSTPTNTQYRTDDIAEQYDVWADVPLNPLNVLAIANWYSSYVHYNYKDVSLDDPGIINQGTYGDTTYYMIPAKILPLLSPVTQLPVIGYPLADAFDAPFRVLVEAAYNRTISPGQPAPFNPLYFPNPVKLAADFTYAIPTGLDNALEDTIGIRPFGTVRPGPYGVGGPDVTYINPPATTETTESIASKADSAAAVHTTSQLVNATSLPSLTDSSAVATDSAAASEGAKAGTELKDDPSAADATTTPSSSNPDPDDGIKEGKPVAGRHALPDSTADDPSAADAATTPSSSIAKPGDSIGLRQNRHILSGITAGTSEPTAKRTSVASSAASGTSSSPGNDNTSHQSVGRHAK